LDAAAVCLMLLSGGPQARWDDRGVCSRQGYSPIQVARQPDKASGPEASAPPRSGLLGPSFGVVGQAPLGAKSGR